MATIRTISGKIVDLQNPAPESIDIEDIAHALSNICRFVGHLHYHYSVAEHSVHVSRLIEGSLGNKDTIMAGLLHDASEAYLGDMSTPLKTILPDYKKLENKWSDIIYAKYNLINIDHVKLKKADKLMLSIEENKYQLNKNSGLSEKKAKQLFLERYYELRI